MRRKLPFGVALLVLAAGLVLAQWGHKNPAKNVPRQPAVKNELRSADSSLNLRSFNGLVLLANPIIQDELGLSDSQGTAIDELVQGFLGALIPLARAAREVSELPELERSARTDEIHAEQVALVSSHERNALELLTRFQQERLEQIALRLRLEEAFYEADIVAELALTSPQLQQISARRVVLLRRANDLRRQRLDDRLENEDYDRQILQLRYDTSAFYESLLGQDQRITWQCLAGERLTFTKDDLQWRLQVPDSRDLANRE